MSRRRKSLINSEQFDVQVVGGNLIITRIDEGQITGSVVKIIGARRNLLVLADERSTMEVITGRVLPAICVRPPEE